jgi:hypothetical protein
VKLTAAETKTGRPHIAAVPHKPTTHVDRWLQVHRPSAQSIANAGGRASGAGARLWLDRPGKPITSYAIHAQITLRTRQSSDNAIWPHLFRDCGVTDLVDCAPEEIDIAPDEPDLQTTQKYYIQAQGMTAHRLIQQVIAARRHAASGVGNAADDHAAGVRACKSVLATSLCPVPAPDRSSDPEGSTSPRDPIRT